MLKTEKEFYRDFYGATASIETRKYGFILTVRAAGGRLLFCRQYSTHRGARIAMSKEGDCWKLTGKTCCQPDKMSL